MSAESPVEEVEDFCGGWSEWTGCSALNCLQEGQRARRRVLQGGGYRLECDVSRNSNQWESCKVTCARDDLLASLDSRVRERLLVGEVAHEKHHGSVAGAAIEVEAGESTEEPDESAGKEDGAEDSKDPVDAAVAVMLLGSIIFFMCLFYLVNYPDHDIVCHSWQVISHTLSIFMAILLYTSFQAFMCAVINHFMGRDLKAHIPMLFLYSIALCWLFGMHLQLRYYTKVTIDSTLALDEKEREPAVGVMQDKLECWSKLMSHMTAFSFIHAGESSIELLAEKSTSLTVFVPVLLMVAFFMLFRMVDVARGQSYKRLSSNDTAALAIWEHVSEEAENDIAGLSVSFLLVEALNFVILSNVTTGVDSLSAHHATQPMSQILLMALAATVFAVLTILHVWISARTLGIDKFEVTEGIDPFRDYVRVRWWFILQAIVANGLSWCLQKLCVWVIAGTFSKFGIPFRPHSVAGSAVIALVTSLLAMLTIFVLDRIEDLEITGQVADSCTSTMICAIGILIGFSWEYTFDEAVEALATLSGEGRGQWMPIILRLLLAIALAALIIPAWRLYILKTARHYAQKRDDNKGRGQTYVSKARRPSHKGNGTTMISME